MRSERVKVGLIQQLCSNNPEDNLNKTLRMIDEAAEKGANLIVLQELHRSFYFCQHQETRNFDLAESIPGKTTEIIGRKCVANKVVIVSSIFERRASGLYHNTAVVIDNDGSIAGIYRKAHIPEDPGFHEKFYFSPGDTELKPIQTSIGKLGVLICWDQWFPEAGRLMAMNGADMLIYPTAIGWQEDDSEGEREKQLDSWMIIQRSHAVANGLPVLSVNRVGSEINTNNNAGIEFWGNSFVCGAQGELIVRGSSEQEEVLIAEINFGETERLRRIWPFFRDRRTDLYKDLLKKWI